MNWYINDLSLSGQFPDPLSFRRSLEPLVRLMIQRRDLKGRIFCSRLLSFRPATASHNFSEAVRATNDSLFVSLVLRWINSSGPFWESERTSNINDLFYFENEDVTDQGLGEAARRLAADLAAESFSFAHSSFQRFAVTPLPVVQGIPEEPLAVHYVSNRWTIEGFPGEPLTAPTSWNQMVSLIRETMPGLILSPDAAVELEPRPFDSGAAERILVLLGVLQRFTEETLENGAWTVTGMELYNRYCTGERARISDSSDPEKREFENEMTFPDPHDSGNHLFCPWHAKLNFGVQYRIHFEWPRPRGQREIKVVYIGPKITKW